MTWSDRDVKRIAIVPGSGYFLSEFFIPLIEKTEGPDRYLVVWDKSRLDRTSAEMLAYVEQLPAVDQVIEVDHLQGQLLGCIKTFKELAKTLGHVDLVLAQDLCCLVMRLLSPVLESRGVEMVFAQTSGLHQNIWRRKMHHRSGALNISHQDNVTAAIGLKILKFHRYPDYMRVLISRISNALFDHFFSFILAPLLVGKILPKMPESPIRYLNSYQNKMIMIYRPDFEVMEDIYRPGMGVYARPPYAAEGDKSAEIDMLVAFPGPMTEHQARNQMSLFWDVIDKVMAQKKPTRVLYRYHPRESDGTKNLLDNLMRDRLGNIECTDVSDHALHDTLRGCGIVVAGVSNLLAVARATSSTRLVIGVLGAGLDGILGTNSQYREIGDVLWVARLADLKSSYLDKQSFAQQGHDATPYSDALRQIAMGRKSM